MPFLNAGKILHVDLTTGEIRTQPTRDYCDRYLGGRAINAALMYDLVGLGSGRRSAPRTCSPWASGRWVPPRTRGAAVSTSWPSRR